MESYELHRSIPVDDGFDVVVAGGGPAGCAAAIAAARMGARVVLVEPMGALGGIGTSGLLTVMDTMSDGERLVTGGVFMEIFEKLRSRGHIDPYYTQEHWSRRVNSYTPYDAEGLKALLDDLCEQAGVSVRFFTRVIDADALHGVVRGAITASVDGYRYLKAKAFIDCTGDGQLCALAGAGIQPGNEKGPMPPTLCAYFDHIRFPLERMNGSMGAPGQQEALERAIAEGFFTQNDRHVPGLFYVRDDLGIMNCGHVFGMDATNCRSLSEGMRAGRRFVREYGAFFRKYMPGFEDARLVASGAIMGVRESRRVVGAYVLGYSDYRARRHFPDQICVYTKAIDIHVKDLSPTEYERYYSEYHRDDKYAPGESYGVPYGAIVARGFANLWVAGRCASADEKVQGSLRVQPACYMMGHAAGVAAAQALAAGACAADIDTAALVGELRAQGAYLPQETLARHMTKQEE